MLYTFALLLGDVDVLFDDDGDGTGGLFDLDFSLLDTLFMELLREIDGDFEDTELSLDDFDGLFSGDRSTLFSTLFSCGLSVDSLSLFVVGLYFGIDVVDEPLLKRE